MTDKQFNVLYSDAINSGDRDAYVSDWALSSMWGDDSDPILLADLCGKVWDLAHLTVSDIRAHTGLTQAAFSERFLIPYRTLQNWEGRGGCAHYTILMLARLCGMADGILQ